MNICKRQTFIGKKTKADEIIKKKGVTGDETGGYVIEKKEPYELVER